MDTFIKLAVLIGALLGGGALFYHYVIYLPDADRQKAAQAAEEQRQKDIRAAEERQRQEQRAEQRNAQREWRGEIQKEEAARWGSMRQQQYDLCMASARKSYEVNWNAACQNITNRRQQVLFQCIEAARAIHDNAQSRARESDCHARFGNIVHSPRCALPRANAESINRFLRDHQERCLAQARLGLQ